MGRDMGPILEEKRSMEEEIAKLTERLKLTVADSESLLARAIQAEQELERADERFGELIRTRLSIHAREIYDLKQERDARYEFDKQRTIRLEEERNALLEGLKWYADKQKYRLLNEREYAEGGFARYEVMDDRGERASSIIAKLTQE